MNEEVEKMIKKLGCRDKNCEHFIENGVWTFCNAIFTDKECEKIHGENNLFFS